MILKGTECDFIEKTQLHTVTKVQLMYQENAWMVCKVMMRWLDWMLKLFISQDPSDIRSILHLSLIELTW